ncbi:MAG: glycine--tRNA ligase subunit beta [Proteobacteria bacterium]|nr:glycine--tRNA ligase subunit beta [Pseudomonadota bacterium]
MSAPLVVELFTEELPPKALKRLGQAFADAVVAGLAARDFVEPDAAVTPYASPRRLAVAIAAVRAVAPDKPFREKLLPVSVAFDAAGKPTAALTGKLKAKGLAHVDPATLARGSDGKAEALFHEGIAKGGPLADALQAVLADAIGALPIPKVMSYAGAGGYWNDEKFVRPAHRLVALHGADVVPVTALGLAAGRVTMGHRFLSRGELTLANAAAYAPTLEAEGKVIPSFAARRAAIVAKLEAAAGADTPVMPEALLDEVASLVEWPVVYAGEFDPAFLAVPQECLILTMQLNQKYFALTDAAGKLGNRFLVVSNLETRDPKAIVGGNERVLRARLADARFFFDQDRKASLESRLPKLDAVVYHNQLGTLGARVARLAALAKAIAPFVGADPAAAERAARLAKADLVTDMVGEFPELQGTMGRYYALHDGEPAVIADAIAEHYAPRFAGDALPAGPVAQAVALADKLEALAGLFSIGQVPTGDKDPFALRRAALGVLRILIEKRVPVTLGPLLDAAFAPFGPGKNAGADLSQFITDRLKGYLKDQGYTTNEVAAVVDAGPGELWLVPSQLAAIRAFEKLPEAPALAAANKRIKNILAKTGITVTYGNVPAVPVDPSLLAPGAETELSRQFASVRSEVDAKCASGDWQGALLALAATRPAVDRFFDDVMVMADDPAVRQNRLNLLANVAGTMNRVADISKLAQ